MKRWMGLILAVALWLTGCGGQGLAEPEEHVYMIDVHEYITGQLDATATVTEFEKNGSHADAETLTVTCTAVFSGASGEKLGVFTLTYANEGRDWALEDCQAELTDMAVIEDLQERKIHRYSFHVENCTWTEAFAAAAEKGGYLVRINSPEELEYILARIGEEGLEDKYFFLGGRRELGDTSYRWADGDNVLFGEVLNQEGSWGYEMWFQGEPSVEFEGNAEYCMEMHREPGAGWGWNDVKQSMLSYAPEDIAYIVEYED